MKLEINLASQDSQDKHHGKMSKSLSCSDLFVSLFFMYVEPATSALVILALFFRDQKCTLQLGLEPGQIQNNNIRYQIQNSSGVATFLMLLFSTLAICIATTSSFPHLFKLYCEAQTAVRGGKIKTTNWCREYTLFFEAFLFWP